MNLFRCCLTGLVLSLCSSGPLRAQTEASDLNVFGYFQPQFYYETDSGTSPAQNSFVLQQLNLFLQKDLSPKLTSFVNFEAVNSFSSDQEWGSFRLEEAWARYRYSHSLSVKVGLQIPIFNNLNEIKNRTPVIPYVVRPLVYESSFVDVIPIRVFVPQQAFVQAFGWVPLRNLKLDYAAYLGNTELVNSGFNVGQDGRPIGQTGVDTTKSVLVGGRAGIRYGELKTGFSATFDRSAVFRGADEIPELVAGHYDNIRRRRMGADASYYLHGLYFEAEWIDVSFDEPEELELGLSFYYVTAGYRITDQLLGYIGYWTTEERVRILGDRQSVDIRTPVIGAAYTLEDQITLKAAYAHVGVDVDFTGSIAEFTGTETFDYFTVAVSVAF